MSREYFDNCNGIANNNLRTRGNLSSFLVSFLELARSLGKEEIALEGIADLPPAHSFEHPDKRVDMVVATCLESKTINNSRVR